MHISPNIGLHLNMYDTFIFKVGSDSVGVGGGGPPQADFVPHIAR